MQLLQVFDVDFDSITELMINKYSHAFIEEQGKIRRVESPFETTHKYFEFITALIHDFDLDLSIEKPFSEKIVYQRFRLTLSHPVISKGDYVLCLRSLSPKVPPSSWFQPFLEQENFKIFMERFIGGASSLVVGGTGSGKTTLVSYLLNHLKQGERVITIEDIPEINVNLPNVVSFCARKSLLGEEAEITLNDLLVLTLRMRPDRIVVGEIRSHEAMPFVHALNTGHEGSIATIHGGSCRSALHRLGILISTFQKGMPLSTAKELVATSIRQVLFMEKRNGVRCVAEICSITGFEEGEFLLESHLP